MNKRTYAGPIIERFVEEGIVSSSDCGLRSVFYVLAVDSGSGDLVLVIKDLSGADYVSFHQPAGYVPKRLRFCNVAFTVTDDLSEREVAS